MDRLVLHIRDYAGPLSWRWLLSREDSDETLADHAVALASGSDYKISAFSDLHTYLKWHAEPDRRTVSELRITRELGSWARKEILGEAMVEAINAAAPATVRIIVPDNAGFLLSWPLQLAFAYGQPLAARGSVAFTYDFEPHPAAVRVAGGRDAESGRPSLRMLAVFSLPSATSVLALRRERYELARLVRGIAARQQRRVELAIVQYGATRHRLTDIAEAGDGWDLLHLSGHGTRGQFLLEQADGSPDLVSTGELVEILAPLRRRLRLAVVSACESAAATTAETLRLVGLDEQADRLEQQADLASEPGSPGTPAEVMSGVARALYEALACPVVAMRYPVTDDFAIAFARDLYERLIGTRDPGPAGRGQSLDIAVARATAVAARSEPSPARPALCVVTPVLIGGNAAGLVLPVPRGTPNLNPRLVRMERFPEEPERFVGRAQAMAAASAALARDSGRSGIVLHGMAGSGKTSCAVELAYRHQDSFAAAAFWQTPLTDDEFGGALASLALALEIQLGEFGFTMSPYIGTAESVAAFAPRLARLLADNGILLVLDNLETLLTPGGEWRDPRWEVLIGALTGHSGESRVILTSRVLPAGIGIKTMLGLAVHALDLAESAALARELPRLRLLLHADSGPVRDDAPAEIAEVSADRELVRRVLRVVQGHPKLMEFADAAATDRDTLLARLDAAELAARGQALDAFFREGTTSLDTSQFLDSLTAWTNITLTNLSDPHRLMAQLVAFLEETDREQWIIDEVWPGLWQRMASTGDAPGAGALLERLAKAALVQLEQEGCRMHPAVAQAIRTAAADIQEIVDAELATFWRRTVARARTQAGDEDGPMVVRAGLAAAPYLIRRQEWSVASELIEHVLFRDDSAAVVQAALSSVRAAAAATGSGQDYRILARVLRSADPAQAESLLRDVLNQAVDSRDFALASSSAGILMDMLRDFGNFDEALQVADQMMLYSREAGLGPWTQLMDQAQRLQILGLTGEDRQVLDQVPVLRAAAEQISATDDSREIVQPWNVREAIFNVGQASALNIGEWQLSLDLNDEVIASMRARGSSDRAVAHMQFNDYGPLIELGRLPDAARLLIEIQQIYEDHDDQPGLARVLSARADVERARENGAVATGLEQTAIRYHYLVAFPPDIAHSHNSLADLLFETKAVPASQRAHRMAAALIYRLIEMTGSWQATCIALAEELGQDPPDSPLPETLADVIAVAEQTDGVHLAEVIASIQPDRAAVEQAFANVRQDASATG